MPRGTPSFMEKARVAPADVAMYQCKHVLQPAYIVHSASQTEPQGSFDRFVPSRRSHLFYHKPIIMRTTIAVFALAAVITAAPIALPEAIPNTAPAAQTYGSYGLFTPLE